MVNIIRQAFSLCFGPGWQKNVTNWYWKSKLLKMGAGEWWGVGLCERQSDLFKKNLYEISRDTYSKKKKK